MYQRLGHIILFTCLIAAGRAQEQQIRFLQPGDTIYKSIDQLPQEILPALQAETGFWDFSSLLAPYVHEVYVRPVANGRAGRLRSDLVMLDADGVERFAAVSESGMSLTGFRIPLTDNVTTTGVCDPPIPLRSTALRPTEATMTGTCTFSIPQRAHASFGLTDQWAADSLRLRVEYAMSVETDGSGALLLPGGQYGVYRERREIQSQVIVEHFRNGRWRPADARVTMALPYELQNGTIYTFWSPSIAEPVAVVHMDPGGEVKRVDFKATPYGGRLITNFPKVPDVFVYPNPSFGEVRFDFVNLRPGQYTLEIYSILGVKQRSLGPLFVDGNRTVPMDLSDLKKGTYIYRLVDQNQNAVRSKRLVIITP
ncbi:MAG: T9SS type A sorting domain-containing protein [Saprospiraceae bacterium]|nr:T9SS type A sorting domain-containing protein [Saprospiraceae bacterium]